MSGQARDVTTLVSHLFRHEAGRLVAFLVRLLGPRNLALAEDIAQDTLCRALEVWKYNRVPEQPSAWLMQVARNRALDVLRREQRLTGLSPEQWESAAVASPEEPAFTEHELRDDLLRMMFACCHPSLGPEAQVTVILKYLGGFGVAEIARAFLTSEAAVEKRLFRARRELERQDWGEVAGADVLAPRLEPVRSALYLLFNEGYHGGHSEHSVREELCHEALRLTVMLTEFPPAAEPATYALLALMCLHAARLPARMDDEAGLVLLEAQDRRKWDTALIARGFELLSRSAAGTELTPYHVEAGIAAKHCAAPSFAQTDWPGILELYELLLRLRPSPVVALNRAIVVGQVHGPQAGLAALAAIPDREQLAGYPFLAAATGELHRLAGNLAAAREHFQQAAALARNPHEARLVEARLAACVPRA